MAPGAAPLFAVIISLKKTGARSVRARSVAKTHLLYCSHSRNLDPEKKPKTRGSAVIARLLSLSHAREQGWGEINQFVMEAAKDAAYRLASQEVQTASYF